MKKKLFYEAPDAELIELKLDAVVMQGSVNSADNGYEDENDLGEI